MQSRDNPHQNHPQCAPFLRFRHLHKEEFHTLYVAECRRFDRRHCREYTLQNGTALRFSADDFAPHGATLYLPTLQNDNALQHQGLSG
jgi:hypothetical protein